MCSSGHPSPVQAGCRLQREILLRFGQRPPGCARRRGVPEPDTRGCLLLATPARRSVGRAKPAPTRPTGRNGTAQEFSSQLLARSASNKVSNAVLLTGRWQISSCSTRPGKDYSAVAHGGLLRRRSRGVGHCIDRGSGPKLSQATNKKGGCHSGIRPTHHRPGGGAVTPRGGGIRRSFPAWCWTKGGNAQQNAVTALLASLDLARRLDLTNRYNARLHPLGDVTL